MTDDVTAQRVILVPLTVEDAAEMMAVLADPDLYAFTGGRPPTLPELRAQYARQVAGRSADGSEEWCNWIIRLVTGRTAVGYVQATIVDDGQRAEIAWVVGREWQGRGYAAEAAAAMLGWLSMRGVRIVQAHIHPDHAASATVARHAGLLPTELFHEGEQLWRTEATRHP